MLCMKRVYKDKQASAHCLAARTKGASRPANKPLVNRWFRSPIGLNENSFVCASGGSFRTVVYNALEGARHICVLRE